MGFFPDGAHEKFRVKPGSFYSVTVPICNRLDEHGNTTGRDLALYSVPIVYVRQYFEGKLVRVTDDPTQTVDFGEPKSESQPETPNVETFVEDKEVIFAPPVEDRVKPRRKPGRPKGSKGSKNKNNGGTK